MGNSFLSRAFIVVWVSWLAVTTYSYVCLVRGSYCFDQKRQQQSQTPDREEKSNPEVSKKEEVEEKPNLTTEQGNYRFAWYDQIQFHRSNNQPELLKDLEDKLISLSEYLNKNKDRDLIIIGAYEKTDPLGARGGLARANSVRDILLKLGLINKNQARLSSKSDSLIYSESGSNIIGCVSFLFQKNYEGLNNLTENEFNALYEELKVDHHIYFDIGSSIMNITPQMHSYFSKLKSFLSQREHIVHIIGHTDNIGWPKRNSSLSRRRAIQVKNYLIDQGISYKLLKIKGKGSSNPIESNETEQGREKNRRVQIKLDQFKKK